MDVSRCLEARIAPRAIFDDLDERRAWVRFKVMHGGGWKEVTFGEFAEQIRLLGLFLLESGLRPGERACVFAPNSVAWAAAAMAIQAVGGVLVPIYPASTSEQAAYILKHSHARVVFVGGAGNLAKIQNAANESDGWRLISLDGEPTSLKSSHQGAGVPLPVRGLSDALGIGRRAQESDPSRFERAMSEVAIEQPGLMLYTSGTTGHPKGVPLTHANVAANGKDWLLSNAPLLEEKAKDVLWLPMSHIFGLGELCIGNSLGWTSYLSDPAKVLSHLPEVAPSVLMSVPAYWEKLFSLARGASNPEERLRELTGGQLTFCLSGGAGLKREVKEFFLRSGILIIEGYGLTETSPTLTLNRPDAYRFDTVGRPLPSVELRLAEDGEILARGPNVFRGYHDDEAATREAFTSDGWFKTGDVGRFTPDGFLQIIDRKKDILVTAGGKNVPPANIELRFADEPLVSNVVVYGDGKRYLVAGVWVNQPATEATRARVEACVERVNAGLASYETIKRVFVEDRPLTVEAGLLTASLKVRRKKIYEAFRERFEALYENRPPGSLEGAS
jgi:long-chain acyl-CoA synthetase